MFDYMDRLFLHALSSLSAFHGLGRMPEHDTRVGLTSSVASVPEIERLMLSLNRFDIRDTPLHLLVDTPDKRRSGRNVVSHVWAGQVPAGSFIEILNGVYISSPECAFMQMACELDQIELIRLGYELCADYRIDNFVSQGFSSVQPITTPERIRSYLLRKSSARGRHRAQVAVTHVRSGARSPRESSLAMLLTLPTRLGGYQLGDPLLNYRVPVGLDVEGRRNRFIDLFWEREGVGLEYDSDLAHVGADRIAHDSVREKVLDREGIRIIRITNEELLNPAKFELAIEVLRRALGKRGKQVSPDIARRRRALAVQLFARHRSLLQSGSA